MKPNLAPNILESLSKLVEQKIGLYFPVGKHNDLSRALAYAADDLGYDDVTSCANWLLFRAPEQEKIDIMVEYLTIGETYFFREAKIFAGLTREIVPEILARKGSHSPQSLRIWSAASATGEEPYSIAMALRQNPHLLEGVKLSILATDINKKYLAKAKKRKYSSWSFRDVPRQIIAKYFDPVDQKHHLLHRDIRKMVDFRQFNLTSANLLSPAQDMAEMDIIFCRNVLIYFDLATREKIISKLSNCLAENGIFITSPSELSLVDIPDLHCRRLQCGTMIFQKKSASLQNIQSARLPPVTMVAPRPPKARKTVVRSTSAAKPPPPPKETKHNDCKQYLTDFAEARYDSIIAELLPQIMAGEKCGDLTDVEAMSLLAEAYANSGNSQDALKWGQKVIKEDKINPGHYFFLATIHVDLGQLPEATECLNKSIFLDHDFVMAYFILATILPQDKASKHLANATAILKQMAENDIVPYSAGMNVGHLLEIISSMRAGHDE